MVHVCKLEKSFADKRVLNKLSFSISHNEIYGLLGPNGAGKTTTINILCNLLDADAGTVSIEGNSVSEVAKRLIGVVPQEISVYQDLTCRENLLFFARIYGLKGSEIIKKTKELILTFSLTEYENTKVSNLSGGWRRRINIAVALVHSPSVLILDEPTAGLDVEARYEIWELIKKLKDRGVSILLTTHHLEEAERLCSRIGILQNGHIVAEGSLEKLRTLVKAKQLAVIETDDEETLCNKLNSIGWDYRRYAGSLKILLPDRFILKDIINTFDGISVSAISLKDVSLEDIYLEVTADKKAI